MILTDSMGNQLLIDRSKPCRRRRRRTVTCRVLPEYGLVNLEFSEYAPL
jgi:hypothetical protein